jgi:hypothetical protein
LEFPKGNDHGAPQGFPAQPGGTMDSPASVKWPIQVEQTNTIGEVQVNNIDILQTASPAKSGISGNFT